MIMKGKIGTASYLSYARPYWGKVIYKLSLQMIIFIHSLKKHQNINYKNIEKGAKNIA